MKVIHKLNMLTSYSIDSPSQGRSKQTSHERDRSEPNMNPCLQFQLGGSESVKESSPVCVGVCGCVWVCVGVGGKCMHPTCTM